MLGENVMNISYFLVDITEVKLYFMNNQQVSFHLRSNT